MARILAIDFGTKRTGIAVTDESGPDVELEMDNSASESEVHILPFISKLEKAFPNIPIKRIDERFTSKMALQTMIDSGLKKNQRKNKALIDEISATLILQSYLYSK